MLPIICVKIFLSQKHCEVLNHLEMVIKMRNLKSVSVGKYLFTLIYDDVTTTFWVTENVVKSILPYQVSFSLLSEAERFFDLLVERVDKS